MDDPAQKYDLVPVNDVFSKLHQSQPILDWFLDWSTPLHYLCRENTPVLGVPIMQFTYSSCLELRWGGLSAISKRRSPTVSQ